MEVNQLFEKFYENILLTSKQKKDAMIKYSGVCKKLHDHFYTDIEYTGDTKLLIGSYGKHTNIRPPRDVDVLFIMPPEKYNQYEDNQSNGQSQLLQDIKKILSEKYTTTDKIKGWGKVVLVQFSDGTHNIELLPVWENPNKTFTIPNSENGGRWENWDVRAELDKIASIDKQSQGYAKKLIRMMKKWSEKCSTTIKSHQIEDTVIAYYQTYGNEEENYGVLIKDIFDFLKENIHDENKSHAQTAYQRAKKAVEFVKSNKIDKAIEEWQNIFGDDFPSAINEKIQNDKEAKINIPKTIINPAKPHGYTIN